MATRDSESPRRRRATQAAKPAAKTARPTKRAAAEELDSSTLFSQLESILSETRPPEALKRGLLLAEKLHRARSAWAVIHDPTFDRLNVALHRGRADPRVAAAAPGEGPVGLAFVRAQPVIEDGLVAVPMIAWGRPVGVLVLLVGASDAPSEEELARLRSIANACGSVAEIARSRAEAERRTRDLESAANRLREGDKTRDALLSHLSHELRTPLTTVKAYLSMALKGKLGELTERQQSALAICDRNSDRLLRLINDLLLTARLSAGKMQLDPRPLGLRAVLKEAAEYLELDAATSGVEIRVGAPEGEVFIRGNKDRLIEAFMHLLERGLRGKREGERIEIEVAPRGRVGAVEVLLRGVDVSDAELTKLFEAFHADGGSPNIGLSIARTIVELHGGHLSAERRGDSLSFQVALPLFAGAVTPAASRPKARKGEIVIVEDDDDCRIGLVEYLTAENYKVQAFEEGKAALERIQKRPPALLLVDLRIPGVDGAALIKTLREGESGQHTPIFVISGAVDAGAGSDQAWGERVDGIFEKPINFPHLMERVREYVAPEKGSRAKD